MKKNVTNDFLSKLGDVVDMPLEDFKRQIVEQKVSIGVIQNLRVMLTSTFEELSKRREALVDRLAKNEISDRELGENTLKGLYAEMAKIEEKCTYLVERAKELLRLEEV